jgi:PAS domain S-box-containing protein
VLLWGADGIMIYNDAYSGFAGGRHPQLLGSTVREGWPEVAAFNDHVMRVGLAGGTLSYRDQELTLHRYGRPEQVWMNLDYSPVFDESGRPAGVIAIVVESTERVLAERRLRESEALFRTLAQGIPQLVWRAAIDGSCIWSSPQWLAYTGQSEGESLGWGWLEAVHPDDVGPAQAAWHAASVTGQLSYEHRLGSAAGERYRWFQTRATAVRDAQGRIVEWLGTSTDIDDLHQFQERQQVMVAELQHRTRNLLGVVRAIAKQTMALTGRGVQGAVQRPAVGAVARAGAAVPIRSGADHPPGADRDRTVGPRCFGPGGPHPARRPDRAPAQGNGADLRAGPA